MSQLPVPQNEMDRLLAFSDLNIDISSFTNNYKELARLAAKIAGTEISLVNLIDSYTQWSVSNFGLDIEQMPREDSVCQYTIMGDGSFEIDDLSADSRFFDKFYVTDNPHLRYYWGIPLRIQDYNMGALCVLDKNKREITPEKAEMLVLIAEEIVTRLKVQKHIEALHSNLSDMKSTQNKILHDIRGPIGGIIGLAEIIREQGEENKLEEVLEFIQLIQKGGRSVLELADEILENDKKRNRDVKPNELTMVMFREKLEKLYVPQAKSKNILFIINTNRETEEVVFPNNKLMQIAGNLISNAMKFTPRFGQVTVDLGLNVDVENNCKTLTIAVSDTGTDISPDRIAMLLDDNTQSTDGTDGEKGFGFGLALVKHLIKGLGGSLAISSVEHEGARFTVTIPCIYK